MCPNGKKLEYISGSSRYDVKTHKMLDRFLQTGKLNVTFAQIGKYSKNICYMNETRPRVTAECCKRFIEENNCNAMKIDFKSDNKKEVYDVAIGMPIIATQISKTKGFIIQLSSKLKRRLAINSKLMVFGLKERSLEKNSSHRSVLQFINIRVAISMSIITYLMSTEWTKSNYTQLYQELPI